MQLVSMIFKHLNKSVEAKVDCAYYSVSQISHSFSKNIKQTLLIVGKARKTGRQGRGRGEQKTKHQNNDTPYFVGDVCDR